MSGRGRLRWRLSASPFELVPITPDSTPPAVSRKFMPFLHGQQFRAGATLLALTRPTEKIQRPPNPSCDAPAIHLSNSDILWGNFWD